MNVVALLLGRLYSQEIFLISLKKFSRPKGHSAAGRFMSIKNSGDTKGSRTRYLLSCSPVPVPTALSRALYKVYITIFVFGLFYISNSWLRSQPQDNYFRISTILANPDIYFCSNWRPEDDLYGQNILPFLIWLRPYAVAKKGINNCCFTWLFNLKPCFNWIIRANSNKTYSDNWVRDVGCASRFRTGLIFWYVGNSCWRLYSASTLCYTH